MTNLLAKDLFSDLINHPKLVWNANNTGCEAKADLMAEIAHDKGYDVSKIWVKAANSSAIFPIYLNEAKTERTYWNYHVAIIIKIINGDSSVAMVIDPSLSNEPKKLDIWSRRISALADEYNINLEFKESHREAFFGPDDIVSDQSSTRALIRRDEILTNSNNLKDPMVFTGFLMKMRGDFVDNLKTNSPKKFEQLETYLRYDPFRSWFQAPFDNGLLNDLLNEHPRYYGIKSNDIQSSINFSDILASALLKELYWEEIGHSFMKLRTTSDELLSGSTPEAYLFKSFWEDDNFKALWFSPFNESDWKIFGLDPETLSNKLS